MSNTITILIAMSGASTMTLIFNVNSPMSILIDQYCFAKDIDRNEHVFFYASYMISDDDTPNSLSLKDPSLMSAHKINR